MTEKGIIFSAPMVQAILDGRKTMTRRPITVLKGRRLGAVTEFQKSTTKGYDFMCRNKWMQWCDLHESQVLAGAPYQVGDHLYVKETHYVYGEWYYNGSDNKYKFVEKGNHPVYFEDTLPKGTFVMKGRKDGLGYYKRLARFMPKKYARLWLEVIDVKVERVQEISVEDAKAEGVSYDLAIECNGWTPSFSDPDSGGSPNCIAGFKSIWDNLYGSDPIKGWEANPWCFVYEFRRIEK